MFESDQFIIILIGTVFLLSLPLLVFLSKTVQNITPYLYMNARLKAKEGKLITKAQFEDMVSAHSLSEISSLLEGTSYGNEMQGVMINDAEALEEVLTKHRAALYGEIMGMMPAKIKDVFSYLDREAEASTIKGIFRDIHGQLATEHESQELVPTGEFHEETLKRMYESRSVAELIPLLEGTSYEPLMEKLPAYEQTKKLNVFESAVDNLVLTETWKVISSRNDLSQIHDYFATKMDLMNLKVLLRAKRDRLSWDVIESFLLPQGSLYQQAKASFGEEEDVRGLINSLEGTPIYASLMEVFPEYEKTSSLVPL
ncbi:MAG: V-type ATPase subunit, partial [Thermodesulfobacteriota bacterium]|nr:V-type ATPase subunit [Thermodesulfobacteriota bacterium]